MILRLALGLCALIATLLVLGFAILPRYALPRFLARHDLILSYSAADFDPTALRFTLHDVSVHYREREIFASDRVEADVEVSLQGPSIDVLLTRPQIDFSRLESGELTLPFINDRRRSPDDSDRRKLVRSVVIENGRVRFEDLATKLVVDACDVSVNARSGSPYEVHFYSRRGTVSYRDHSLAASLLCDAVIARPIRIRSFRMEGAAATVEMRDQVLASPIKDLKLNGQIDVTRFVSEFFGVATGEGTPGSGAIPDGLLAFSASIDLPERTVRARTRSDLLRVVDTELTAWQGESVMKVGGSGVTKGSMVVGGGRASVVADLRERGNRADVGFTGVDIRSIPALSKRLPLEVATAATGSMRVTWSGWKAAAIKAEGRANLDAAPQRSGGEGIPIGGEVDFTYGPGAFAEIRPSTITILPGIGTLRIEGTAGSPATGLQMSAHIDDSRRLVQHLSSQLPKIPEALRNLSGQIDLTGRMGPDFRTFTGGFSSASISTPAGVFSDVTGSLERDGDRIELNGVSAKYLHGRVDASLQIDGGRYETTLRGESLRLPDLAAPIETGTMNVVAEAQGELDAPRLAGHFQIESISTMQTEPISGGGTFELDRESLVVQAASEDQTISGGARLELTPPYPLHITGQAAELPLLRLLKRFRGHEDESAEISGGFEIGMPLQNARCIEATAAIDTLGVRIEDVAFNNAGAMRIALSPESVRFESSVIEALDHKIGFAGTIPLEAGGSADFELRGEANLELLHLLVPSIEIGGIMEVDARITGEYPKLAANGKAELIGCRFAHARVPFPISEINGRADLDGSIIRIESLSGRLPQGTIELAGAIPAGSLPLPGLGGDGAELDLSLAVRGLGAQSFRSIMPERFADRIDFVVDADLDLGGTLLSLQALRVDGVVREAEVSVLGKKFIATPDAIRVWKQGDRVGFDGAHFSGSNIVVRGAGTLDTEAAGGALDVSVQAEADNRAFLDILKDAELRGTSSADIRIGGTIASPAISGTALVNDAAIRMMKRRLDLSRVNGRIQFEGTRAQVNGTGVLNGGPFEVAGEARFEARQIAELDLDAAFERCGLFYPEGLSGGFAGRLHLGQTAGRRTLSGDLWLQAPEYRKNIGIEREIIAGFASKEKPKERPFPDLGLELRLSTQTPGRLRNNMADFKFEGDIGIAGTVASPILLGQVLVHPDGKLFFQGRQYKIEKGSLSFLGDPGFNPLIDAVATTDVRVTPERGRAASISDRHTIEVSLTGQLSDLDPTLQDRERVAPLSETEIASLLLTGQLLSESTLDSADQLKGQLTRFLGGRVGAAFLPGLGRKIGVDRLELQPSEISSDTETPTARAIIGKDLGAGFSFTYSPDLSNSQYYLWHLDYQLNRSISLRASRLDDASYVGSATYGFGFDPRRGKALKAAVVISAPELTGSGAKARIKEIVIEGLRDTSEGLVRRQLELQPGDELNIAALSKTQRNLYALNIFRNVRVFPEQVAGRKDLVIVRVILNEQSPYVISSTFRYSTEGDARLSKPTTQNAEGFDGELEVHNINLFGRGIDLGVYTRLSPDLRHYSAETALPYLFGRKIRTYALVSRRTSEDPTFKNQRTYATAQAEHKIADEWRLQYFYTYNRTRIDLMGSGSPAFTFILTRAGIGTSILADYRDDPFNARRGVYGYMNVKFLPKPLLSDVTLLKMSTQLAVYYTFLGKVTLALNNRFGWLDTFGQDLSQADAFFTGGSSSLRSFGEELVGPMEAGTPQGGRAMLVYNQEVRFPIRPITEKIKLGGVLFHDAGNVFRETTGVRPFDLRQSVGLGFRLDTPYSLFRLDYAITVDPRPGENRNRFVFGLGQMF